MRQAGVIAAPGIVALETMVERLAEDHAGARFLAERLAELPGIRLNPLAVETNIVLADLKTAPAASFIRELSEKGVLVSPFGAQTVRLVTHKDVSRRGLEQALAAIQQVLKNISPPKAFKIQAHPEGSMTNS